MTVTGHAIINLSPKLHKHNYLIVAGNDAT
jgi:hypothetical protein